MLQIKRRHRNRIDIADSGALSDLAFLLIIFFIVIAVFNLNSGFLLGLPQRDSQRAVLREELLRVHVAANGAFNIDGVMVSGDQLRQETAATRAARPNMTLLATIHPDAPYGAVIALIDIVRAESVTNFSFRMDALE